MTAEVSLESLILTEVRDNVGILTLNRPRQFNSLSLPMLGQLDRGGLQRAGVLFELLLHPHHRSGQVCQCHMLMPGRQVWRGVRASIMP